MIVTLDLMWSWYNNQPSWLGSVAWFPMPSWAVAKTAIKPWHLISQEPASPTLNIDLLLLQGVCQISRTLQIGHKWNTIKCQKYNYSYELDESTARWQLKSPRSLSGRSIHLTLVTKWSWSWMTYCHPLCAMSTGPPILRYSYFKIWPWKFMVKVTFDIQISKVKVMVKVKPIGHIWGLEFNRYVCFLFRGNRTTFGWDIATSIFDLENSRSRSRLRSNLMAKSEALEFNRIACFSFHGNQTIFGWDRANSIFDLENSRCRYVCFSFRGNRAIFGWDMANSIFDLEKSRWRSRRKSTKI